MAVVQRVRMQLTMTQRRHLVHNRERMDSTSEECQYRSFRQIVDGGIPDGASCQGLIQSVKSVSETSLCVRMAPSSGHFSTSFTGSEILAKEFARFVETTQLSNTLSTGHLAWVGCNLMTLSSLTMPWNIYLQNDSDSSPRHVAWRMVEPAFYRG